MAHLTAAARLVTVGIVKIRVGFGLGTATSHDPDRFGALVEELEQRRFDSLWLSERLTGTAMDPLVGMAFAVARTRRLKVGTSVMVLPGRNPVVLAKAIASLDRLSSGRVLPAFGLGAPSATEHRAFGVERGERAAWFDEALPLIQRLWREDRVSHHGARFHLDDVTLLPKPVQQPLDVWGGGTAPSELRRVGRFCNGWLPSFCTPDQVAAGRREIERVADEHDRAVDPEHYGALVPYRPNGSTVPEALAAVVAHRNPDADPAQVAPTLDELPDALGRFIDEGFSKFVVVPIVEPAEWHPELAALTELVKPLEN